MAEGGKQNDATPQKYQTHRRGYALFFNRLLARSALRSPSRPASPDPHHRTLKMAASTQTEPARTNDARRTRLGNILTALAALLLFVDGTAPVAGFASHCEGTRPA